MKFKWVLTFSGTLRHGEAMYFHYNQYQCWYQENQLEKHLSLCWVFSAALAVMWEKSSLQSLRKEGSSCLQDQGGVYDRMLPLLGFVGWCLPTRLSCNALLYWELSSLPGAEVAISASAARKANCFGMEGSGLLSLLVFFLSLISKEELPLLIALDRGGRRKKGRRSERMKGRGAADVGACVCHLVLHTALQLSLLDEVAHAGFLPLDLQAYYISTYSIQCPLSASWYWKGYAHFLKTMLMLKGRRKHMFKKWYVALSQVYRLEVDRNSMISAWGNS